MKKLLMTLPMLGLFLASCGGAECDASTAEGAAKCYCELEAEYAAANANEDDEAKKETEKKLDKLMEEAEKHMDAGDYSENDVEKIINETCES